MEGCLSGDRYNVEAPRDAASRRNGSMSCDPLFALMGDPFGRLDPGDDANGEVRGATTAPLPERAAPPSEAPLAGHRSSIRTGRAGSGTALAGGCGVCVGSVSERGATDVVGTESRDVLMDAGAGVADANGSGAGRAFNPSESSGGSTTFSFGAARSVAVV